MRLEIEYTPVGCNKFTVTLSERNVRSLLHKLAMPGSYRTIVKREDGGLLILKVENDDEHYDRADGPPGPMHPQTEAAIRVPTNTEAAILLGEVDTSERTTWDPMT